MNLKDHPTIIVIPLILTAAALAWTVGYNSSENRVKTLEARINAFEMSKSLQLPELLGDLRAASKQLKSDLEMARELTKTKEQLALVQKRVSDLEPLEAQLRQAETALKSLYSEVDNFTLREGESRNLLGYEIAVAVHHIDDSAVTVLFDNKSVQMKIGADESTTHSGKTCRLRLNSLRYKSPFDKAPPSSADFTFIVAK